MNTLTRRHCIAVAARCRPHRTAGFTLIEALITIAVLAVGLLGLAALQATAQAFGDDARFRTEATLLADDLIERVRLYSDNADAFVSVGAPGSDCRPGAAPDIDNELACWYEAVQQRLPAPGNGQPPAEIQRVQQIDGRPHYVVVVRWRGRDPRPLAHNANAHASEPADVQSMRWAFRP